MEVDVKSLVFPWFPCSAASYFGCLLVSCKQLNVYTVLVNGFWMKFSLRFWQMFKIFYYRYGFALDPKPWMNHIENLPYLMGKDTAFFKIKVSFINRLWDAAW